MTRRGIKSYVIGGEPGRNRAVASLQLEDGSHHAVKIETAAELAALAAILKDSPVSLREWPDRDRLGGDQSVDWKGVPSTYTVVCPRRGRVHAAVGRAIADLVRMKVLLAASLVILSAVGADA